MEKPAVLGRALLELNRVSSTTTVLGRVSQGPDCRQSRRARPILVRVAESSRQGSPELDVAARWGRR